MDWPLLHRNSRDFAPENCHRAPVPRKRYGAVPSCAGGPVQWPPDYCCVRQRRLAAYLKPLPPTASVREPTSGRPKPTLVFGEIQFGAAWLRRSIRHWFAACETQMRLKGTDSETHTTFIV